MNKNRYLILLTGSDLSPVYDFIKTMCNGWWKHMPSSFLAIVPDSSAVEIRDKIRKKFPGSSKVEKIIVFEITRTAAWAQMTERGSVWLKENL